MFDKLQFYVLIISYLACVSYLYSTRTISFFLTAPICLSLLVREGRKKRENVVLYNAKTGDRG